MTNYVKLNNEAIIWNFKEECAVSYLLSSLGYQSSRKESNFFTPLFLYVHYKYIQCKFYTFYVCPTFHCNPTVLVTFNHCSTVYTCSENYHKFERHIFLYVQILYMSFDRFLLAVESCDLSQGDKILIRVSSFPKLSDGQQNLFFCLSTI